MAMVQQPMTKQLVPAELRGVRPAGSYSFDELFRLAQMCHASGLFADITDAAQAMVKVVKGQEMGLPPMTAMTAFDIINKRLFVKPWVIAAKINSCGYGAYRVLVENAEACTIGFSRRYAGDGWQTLPPITYAIVEAQAHGLVSRSAHWKSSPAHMLYLRAMGRGGLMYFPELLAGLEAAPDETPVSSDRHATNIADLFGDDPRGSTPTEAPRLALQPQAPAPASCGWRDTIEKHLIDTDLPADRVPAALREECLVAFHAASVPDSVGLGLAGALLDALRSTEEGT